MSVETLTRIIHMQSALNDDLSVTRVMQLVVESAEAITRATGAVVEIADGDALVYRATSGSALPHVGLRIPREGSLSGLCVRSGKILSCADADSDPRVDRAACQRVGVRSMLVVPLNRKQETIGVLKVLSTAPGSFSEDDAHVLQLLAGFIASALHRAAAFEHTQHQALHDPLTGLPNRILFMNRITHQLTRMRREQCLFAILYIDLDGFKRINDGLGHAAGDLLLAAVAERLRRSVRESDTVARLGGDEFAILAPRLTAASNANVIASNVLDALLGKPIMLSGGAVSVGASIGSIVASGGDRTAEQLLAAADESMYETKRTRRSQLER